MNILQICLRCPYPAHDGGSIAMAALAEGFAEQGHQVKMLTLNTSKHFVKTSNIPDETLTRFNIEAVAINNDITFRGAFLNLFANESYHVSRFYKSNFVKKLTEILQKQTYDLIILESIYMATYLKTIRENYSGKIAIRSHNVEHQLWSSVKSTSKNKAKRAYLALMIKRLRTFELEALNSADLIFSISNADTEEFKQFGISTPIINVPLGIEINNYKCKHTLEKKGISFFHIGSMDWQPNIEGIAWFLKEIWPNFVNKNPDAELNLAGKNMPNWLKNYKFKGVKIHGKVANAQQFICSNSIKIVPLFSGSGIRVKILEVMAAEKPIIATTVAAAGLPLKHNENVLIANTKSEMLLAMQNLYNDINLRKQLSDNALQTINTTFDKSIIIKNLIDEMQNVFTD